MKIMDVPTFGPTFRFTDANIYYALYLLSKGDRMGRKVLADACGIGEGSMRKIITKLREWDFIDVKQTGIQITDAGKLFLEQIPIRLVDVSLPDQMIGKYHQAVIVFGVAFKIKNGMKQRDAGVRTGAVGCTTIVLRNGHLMIPPDWNIDEHSPADAAKIREITKITSDDALIIGDANQKITAVEAAINAAFDLI